jgi:AcrR family transcriptional regulator
VFEAALAIIDAEGLENLTMRRLAAALGTGAATLYGYVRSREDVLDGIARLLMTETDTAVVPGEHWMETIRRNARAYRRIAHRHPRAFGLLALRYSDDPEGLRHVARVIALFKAAGFTTEQALLVNTVTDAYGSGFCLIEAQALSGGLHAGDTEEDRELLTPVLQTRVTELISEEGFERGLDLILSGIAAAMTPGGSTQP